MPVKPYKALTQPIFEYAAENPDRLAVMFIHEDGIEEPITAEQFHRKASSFSHKLLQLGIQQDDIVILVLDHKPDLLYAFWGAIYMGAVPSIFPLLNDKLDPEFYLKQVTSLVTYSGAKAVITGEIFEPQLRNTASWETCQLIGLERFIENGGKTDFIKDFSPASYPSKKIAFLQHSSGTTGLQKGVALSHQAVLNQLNSYGKAIELSRKDIIVSWLPLYHDMGLIAGFVLPIVMGIPLVLMSPFQWVRDPKKLLWAVTKYKGTLSWLPNFAYNHMHRAIRTRDLEGMDLSSWRLVINCSEPVRFDSHQKFYERFSTYGLGEHTLATCYAMAENTFAVTQSRPDQAPFTDWVSLPALQEDQKAIPVPKDSPEATPVVSCGYPIEANEIKILGPGGAEIADRNVGEVAIHSHSMLSEYHRKPELTSKAMRNGWFLTGDLGYIAEGQLFISGRKKDLIIVGGKNVFPADLEAVANHVKGVHPGRAVAFGVYDDRMGTESVVMVCELENGILDEEKLEIEREVRKRVSQESDVTLADVRLVDSKWLIKTSSGKLARAENRERYLREFRGQA